MEAAVLRLVLEFHPDAFTKDELLREITQGGSTEFSEVDANERAVRDLAAAGPVLGTAATLIPLTTWLATGSDLWRALAYIGFFINLINLMPVLPLDGGRANGRPRPLGLARRAPHRRRRNRRLSRPLHASVRARAGRA